ncbi:SusD/RagB family nutrient-binding outer membrane lipoprotein [Portibacter lacus]|nr:SusD/RagB family nutrient-binding outer membrane lipoprotein [Portibacter lacus]
MNKLFKRLTFLIVVFTISACTKDFDIINTNPNAPDTVPTSYLMTNAQTYIMTTLRNNGLGGRMGMLYAQYWSQLALTDESRYYVFSGLTNNSFRDLYLNLYDLQDIINKCKENPEENGASGYAPNQIAVAMIMQAYTFHIMTDIWGDIPYSEALQAKVNTTPVYDQSEDIYRSLIEKLKEAINLIDVSQPGMRGDIIYTGNMNKWKRFANSLIMRIGLRSGDLNAVREAAPNAFQSNDDNANFQYAATGSAINPLYVDWVENKTLGKQFAVSKTLVDYMLNNNDTMRLAAFATNLEKNPNKPAIYRGLTYGLTNNNSILEFFKGVSLQTERIYKADASTPLMNYDEVLFILAEIDNDEGKFREGVKNSAMNWGVEKASAQQLADEIEYKGLESIINEKWVANYMQGIQGWAEYRRTGYPELKAPVDGYHPSAMVGDLVVPNRRQYPPDESQLNGVNYNKTVEKLLDPGGQQQTPMFWQK